MFTHKPVMDPHFYISKTQMCIYSSPRVHPTTFQFLPKHTHSPQLYTLHCRLPEQSKTRMYMYTCRRRVNIPCRRTVFWPRGARKASWSKVMISPPALRILAWAPSVTRSAQIWREFSTCTYSVTGTLLHNFKASHTHAHTQS